MKYFFFIVLIFTKPGLGGGRGVLILYYFVFKRFFLRTLQITLQAAQRTTDKVAREATQAECAPSAILSTTSCRALVKVGLGWGLRSCVGF